jgi:hypothetical protein
MPKQSITYEQALELNNAIARSVDNPEVEQKLAYAMEKNRQNLKKHIEAITKFAKSKDPEKAQAFNRARIALSEKHAAKDPDGIPLRDPSGQAYILADTAAFEAEFDKLKEEHKEVISMMAEQEKELEAKVVEALPEEVFIHTVSLADIPQKGFRLVGLLLMIAPSPEE